MEHWAKMGQQERQLKKLFIRIVDIVKSVIVKFCISGNKSF